MQSNALRASAKKRRRRDNLTAYAFLSPWIIGFFLFSGFPIIFVFVISFTNRTLLGSSDPVGFANYAEMFSSGSFWNSLKVTLIFAIVSVIVTVIWAFFLAMLLNRELRGNSIFQFFYFVPAVVPSVALAFAFQMLFNKDAGIVNYAVSTIFNTNFSPNWLYDETLVYPTVFFIMLFTYSTGQMILIFRSGLKEVPRELYEAAQLDGANFIQRFLHVTMPAVSPIILFNTVMATIGALNSSFSLLFPLTGGGPNEATNVLSLSIYKEAFMNYRIGYACCLAVVLFLIAAVFASVQFKLSNKWVYYEN